MKSPTIEPAEHVFVICLKRPCIEMLSLPMLLCHTMKTELSTQPLFHTAAAEEYVVLPAELPELLQTLRKAIQTGMVEMFIPDLDKRYTLFYAGGELVNIYLMQDPASDRY